MIQHIFDPAMSTFPITVKADPGRITIGKTSFFELETVYGLELTPIQASILVLALNKAIAAEIDYSEQFERSCKGPSGAGFDGFFE